MVKTKALTWLIPIVILIFTVAFIPSCTPKEKEEVIKIGAILPLTGSLGFMGEGSRNAMLLAKEQMSNHTKYKYELIFEDSKLDPSQTASAVNKLIEIDKVDVLISLTSGTGNIVSPIAENRKVIHFAISSDPKIAEGKYNFQHWTPPEEHTKTLIEELKKRGLKRVSIIRMNQEGETSLTNHFKEKINNTNIKIVSDQVFNVGERDFKTIILKSEQKNPDIYLLLAFSPEVEILVKQMKELGIQKPLTAIGSFELSKERNLFEGYWYIASAEPTDNFKRLYQNKYGDQPPPASHYAYDVFNLIVQAYEKAGKDKKGKPSKEEVIKALNEVVNEYSGAVGKLKILEDGRIWSKAVVREIRNGTPITIG